MTNGRISFDVDTWESGRAHYASMLDFPLLPCGMSYKNTTQAKADLKVKLLELALEKSRADHNTRRKMLMCGDGTVILIEYRFDTWQYSMFHPGKGYPGSCCGRQTFEEVLEDATRHAEQVFGGVVATSG